MKVFKFGGASVKDAMAVRNVSVILNNFGKEPLLVVVSAMGKTTNALEKVVDDWYNNPALLDEDIRTIENYHNGITSELFTDPGSPVFQRLQNWFTELRSLTCIPPSGNFDRDYDQVVSLGELISTTIVHEFLQSEKRDTEWLDVRNLIRTDDTWREGKVDWSTSASLIRRAIMPELDHKDSNTVFLTQGFLGSTSNTETTTLGREGSDYTAAIFSYALDAEEMIIWKDVPGLLNADPKYFSKTEKLAAISFREAMELSYYGATIIHPKTIKPLQNKDIPLLIRSFVEPEAEGTIIHQNTSSDSLIPSFIFKVDQVLISISPRDFSFIDEQNLSEILAVFAETNVHIHLMQNTALSFSVCVDNNERRLKQLFKELEKKYKIRYNTNLELITIRHYDQATIDRVMEDGKSILLEMRSRVTAQFVVKNL
ncbi:MAG: aspartate kinase [Bacteroidetes bacterium]|nr:aspartate kinase [Bacteroidota bacterium]